MPPVRLHDDVLRRIAKVRARMHDEMGETLRVSDLARQACLSEQQFVRLFRAAYEVTPGSYLGRLRIAEAKRLLSRGSSVTETCLDVGYTSLGTFSHRFTLQTSLSPRAFQRQMRAFGTVPERLAALYIPMCFVQRHCATQNVDFEEAQDAPNR